MLRIKVPIAPEGWDDEKQEFVEAETVTLELEHSLVSLAKWESKWHKSFLAKNSMTDEETIDYIRFMTLNENVDPEVYGYLSRENIDQIREYINDPMTATYFSNNHHERGSRETVTAELIYYWMIALNINFECQYWHLNRLITLIKVCNIKNAPPKKMSKREITSRNAALNAARRQQLNTRG